jgi:hypothetical protein
MAGAAVQAAEPRQPAHYHSPSASRINTVPLITASRSRSSNGSQRAMITCRPLLSNTTTQRPTLTKRTLPPTSQPQCTRFRSLAGSTPGLQRTRLHRSLGTFRTRAKFFPAHVETRTRPCMLDEIGGRLLRHLILSCLTLYSVVCASVRISIATKYSTQ